MNRAPQIMREILIGVPHEGGGGGVQTADVSIGRGASIGY